MKNINKLLSIVFFLVTILFLCHNRIFAEEIKITSPIEGVIVHPGQEIQITVETVDKYNINSVLIVTPSGVKEFLAPPYNWSIVIPDMLGTLSIVAGGKNLKGEFFFDKITLNNQSNETLGSISVLPDAIYFDWPEQKIQLSVQGTYSGGKIGYITSSELGTTYNSDNPLVAVVDKNGLVAVRGNGNCTITVSNSGKAIIIPVEVLMPEFIPATIDIEPNNLYFKSDEKYIISHIELPQNYYAQDINIETVSLNAAIPCEVSSAQIGNYNNNGIADLTVKFVRQDLWYVLERGEQVSVAISGEIGDKFFRGTDIIKVLNETPTVPFQQFSITSTGAYFINGTYRESLSSNLAYNFTTNTATGSLKCNFITIGGRATVQTTSVTSASVPEQGVLIFNGACTVNGIAGYTYAATFKDIATPGAGKDIVSITITGPNNYKLEFLNKTIAAGDIAISAQ